MSKQRAFICYWLPVLLCMALIFSASSDQGSFKHSSRIVGPFLHWLFPTISDSAVHLVVIIVRKCAHLTEFAILSLLIWRAYRRPQRNDRRPWQWSIAGKTILLVLLYAASDEFHQLFVPSREGTVRDVVIDTTGGVCGLLLLWAVGQGLGWWRAQPQVTNSPVP